MRFLVDAHLPRRLALHLREAGHDAIHTLDLPNQNRTKDSELLALADSEKRVLVTKDADFVNSFHISGRPSKLLLISTGNIRVSITANCVTRRFASKTGNGHLRLFLRRECCAHQYVF